MKEFKPNSVFNEIQNLNMNTVLPKKVIGDQDRLIQLAINIISNAISNTYAEGEIKVFVHYNSDTEKLMFIVNDNGLGI
tara:strand:- start:529 stop:765 length:237 start_codon:yes stop_codon:yes gene_type:complete